MTFASKTATFARSVICAGTLVALSADIAAAAPARVIAKVNLRLGPGTTYGVAATIPGGSVVDVTNCAGEWCTVNWRGRIGYAVARNLDLGGAGPVTSPYPPAIVGAPPVVMVGPPYGYGGPGYGYWGPGYGWGPRWGWRRW